MVIYLPQIRLANFINKYQNSIYVLPKFYFWGQNWTFNIVCNCVMMMIIRKVNKKTFDSWIGILTKTSILIGPKKDLLLSVDLKKGICSCI